MQSASTPPPRRAPDAVRRRRSLRHVARMFGGAYVLLGVVCLLFLGSCCATNRLWRGVDDPPTRLVAASLDASGTLYAALEHESGESRVLEADLGGASDEWRRVTARRAGPFTGELPATAHPIDLQGSSVPRADSVSVRLAHHVDPTSKESHTLWVEGPGYLAVVACPAPVDWGSAGPYFAVLLTPVTLVVDILTSPIHVTWVVATAGGHGDPWLPWCGD